MFSSRRLLPIFRDIEVEAVPLWREGKVANYIPALGSVRPDQFSLCIATVDGKLHEMGDTTTPFSIQSISKLFALTLAIDLIGDEVWDHLGRSPTNSAFNSLAWIETERGRPYNPFVNAGALAVTNLIVNRTATPTNAILHFVRDLAHDDEVDIDFVVGDSERATCDRNLAIAHLMKAYGTIAGPVETVLDVYCNQCAIAMTTRQLAIAGLAFAKSGVSARGRRVIDATNAHRINALLAVAGMYDAAGEFAFRVGLPAKSGVGGGILAIVPGECAIAVWSPALDAHGNSSAGMRALEILSQRLKLSVFRPPQ